MSRAQLQQDIANTLALAGQDWVQESAALNATFANMLTSLDNMANQLHTVQTQAAATATATAQTAKISKLLADPGPFDGSMAKFEEWWAKFEEWWAKVKAWRAENHLAMPSNTDKPVHTVLSRLAGPKAGSFARTRLEILNAGETYTMGSTLSRIRRTIPTSQSEGLDMKEAQGAQTRSDADQ